MSEPIDNKCGSCTACCRVYAIPAIDKPAGKWCTHCTVGKCCNIYETRPEACVTFKCLWLHSQDHAPMDDDLRPDRCKVVFAPSTNERVMTAITMPGSPDAYKRKNVKALIEKFNLAGLAVAVGQPAGTTQRVFTPDGQEKVVQMTPPDENGMQWSIKPEVL